MPLSAFVFYLLAFVVSCNIRKITLKSSTNACLFVLAKGHVIILLGLVNVSPKLLGCGRKGKRCWQNGVLGSKNKINGKNYKWY